MLHNLIRVLTVALVLFITFCSAEAQGQSNSARWVGTWSTAPQLVETANNPPAPGLTNNTIRQVVHVSIGGDSLRMRFTNEFSTSAVVMNSVHIAISKGNGVIDTTTDRVIYFKGMQSDTMAPSSAVMSDAFQFSLPPLTDVAITISFGSTSPDVTGHPGSRTTSYILTGDKINTADFSAGAHTDHWYVINTIEVQSSDSASAISILGDSITDGRGSGTNKQDRWPDELAIRLQSDNSTKRLAILNEGIGGNCVLAGGLGPYAVSRFQRDVLNQNGVKYLIILEGINDIGGSQNAATVSQNLINAFGNFIDQAHAQNILVYGATLTPFGGSSYDSPTHQIAGRALNDWIRHSGRFDGVIDFDSLMHDPANPARMLPANDSGDHLHPSETGHYMMAQAVNLSLFGVSSTTGVNGKPGKLTNSFSLLQNYPNPFNPVTTIQYVIPKSEHVTITVYDTLGKMVAELVNEIKNAGEYKVNFNTTHLASGVYLYKISAGDFTDTKKMVLMK